MQGHIERVSDHGLMIMWWRIHSRLRFEPNQFCHPKTISSTCRQKLSTGQPEPHELRTRKISITKMHRFGNIVLNKDKRTEATGWQYHNWRYVRRRRRRSTNVLFAFFFFFLYLPKSTSICESLLACPTYPTHKRWHCFFIIFFCCCSFSFTNFNQNK